MNKGMIMLGLLLIVGLSFAIVGPWEYPWQAIVWHKYSCSLAYNSYYQYQLAYGYLYAYADPSDMMNLFYGFNDMNYDLGLMAPPNGYYANVFKGEMLGYNSDNTAFKAIFNRILRAYMEHADASGRAYVLGLLQGYNGNYQSCIGLGSITT